MAAMRATVVATLPNIQKLKPEQEQVLLSFLGGNDVVALLPTEFGKSLFFQLRQLAPLRLGHTGCEAPGRAAPRSATIEQKLFTPDANFSATVTKPFSSELSFFTDGTVLFQQPPQQHPNIDPLRCPCKSIAGENDGNYCHF